MLRPPTFNHGAVIFLKDFHMTEFMKQVEECLKIYPKKGDTVVPIQNSWWTRAKVINDSICNNNTNLVEVQLRDGRKFYINVDYIKKIDG